MSDGLLWLTSYVVNAMWQLPLMFAAGWCLSRWLKPTGPELQHRVWIAVLILATLTPATPNFQTYLAQQTASVNGNGPSPAVSTSLADRDLRLISSDMVLTPTLIYFISWLYIASLLFFSIRLCGQIRCTSTLVGHAGPASIETKYVAMWNVTKERFSIRTAALLRSDDVSGPVTAGLRHPVVLLPAAFFDQHSQTEFLAAIGHECAHIRRNDYRKNLFYEVIAVVTAFHPVTWFIKSQIAQTREMVCDRMAAEQFSDRRGYGQCLLQLASKMPTVSSAAFHTIGMFDRDILERRIMTLMTSSPRVTRFRRYLLGGTAVVLLSICAGVAGSFTQPVGAQTPRQPESAKNQESGPDLDCTYYDDKTVGFPGTCGRDKQDKAKFICYKNQDPTISQRQIGCEWKVLRAEQAKKK